VDEGRRVDIPKTEKSLRRVPLRASLATAIRKRRLERGASDTDFIFTPKAGMQPPLHGNWRRRGWEPAIEDAGLAEKGIKITPHDARHAYASRMRASAVATSDIAEALGHTTTRTTEKVYLHVYDRELLEDRLRKASEA
jgi:integrase